MKSTNIFSKNIKKPKLLIVDDSSNNRSAISYWLNGEDYEILHAVDGPSALKIVEAFLPDIILLDYNLPGMDGIEVCQKIRINKNLPFIPIIMMSSYAPEAQILALEQGADEFIIMPVSAVELKSRLRAMLRLKGAVSESIQLFKENKKLQELDKIKSNFISKVSHELKTPLQAILGYTDILLEGLQGELNLPQKLMIKQIKEGGEKLLSLIIQLLDLESIDEGKIIPHFEVFDIEVLFKHLYQISVPLASKKKITLNFILENKDIDIKSDKIIVEKMLLNIISNAIKFSQENKTVTVIAKEFDGDSVEIKIIDEGIGLSEESITNVFDRFWQKDDSITREHSGLGIGLTLAKKLVSLVNGQILIDSRINSGTIVKVILPKENSSYKNEAIKLDSSHVTS